MQVLKFIVVGGFKVRKHILLPLGVGVGEMGGNIFLGADKWSI